MWVPIIVNGYWFLYIVASLNDIGGLVSFSTVVSSGSHVTLSNSQESFKSIWYVFQNADILGIQKLAHNFSPPEYCQLTAHLSIIGPQ